MSLNILYLEQMRTLNLGSHNCWLIYSRLATPLAILQESCRRDKNEDGR